MIGAVRNTVARWLEQGSLDGVVPRALGRIHGSVSGRLIARPLVLPLDVRSVTVGGATLGGSGKTRVALASACALARNGAAVTLIGHGYGARPAHPREVSPEDEIGVVGDEALASARALRRFDLLRCASNASNTSSADVDERERSAAGAVRVVVAPSRQEAAEFAVTTAGRDAVLVIDGPLQLAPRPASLALLAVDSEAPWGALELPPAGDLRAPVDRLLAHADFVVPVDRTPEHAIAFGEETSLSRLASMAPRIGLFTAIARSERLEGALTRAGLKLSCVVRAGDHGPLTSSIARSLRDARVDMWVATEKCATHLTTVALERPVAVLSSALSLPPSVSSALAALSSASRTVGASPTPSVA